MRRSRVAQARSGEALDPYEVLEVPSGASTEAILAAFRRKARALHPDVNPSPDAEDQFRRLRAAYDLLRDRESRARYDQARDPSAGPTRARGRRPSSVGAEDLWRESDSARSTEGESGRAQARRTRARRGFPGDLGFEDIRVGTEDLRPPPQTTRQELRLTVPLSAAYTGTTLSVTLERPHRLARDRTKFKVRIPAGVTSGDQIIVEDPPTLVTVDLRPDPRFRVEGRDVTTDIEVLPWDAALGASVTVEKPAGWVRVQVPPGTSSDQRLRLKGQGIPASPGLRQVDASHASPGDFFVRVRVVLPNPLSQRQVELFRELKQSHLESHPPPGSE